MSVAVARQARLRVQRAPARRAHHPARRAHHPAWRRRNLRASACRSLLRSVAVWLVASCLELRPASADALPRAPEPGSPAPPGVLELRVTYRAPEPCPSGTDFLDALRAHLTAGGEGAVDADVRISRADEAAFELRLRLRVADRETESVVRAESCAPLVQLAALNASMARTRAVARAPTTESVPALASLAASGASRPRAEEMGEVPGHDAAAASDESLPARDAPRPLRVFVLAELATASGMLPGTAWGRGLAAGMDSGLWSAKLGATFWLPRQREFSFDGSSPIPLEFEQQTLELSPCVLPALSALSRLGGCASLAVHRVQTSAEAARLIGSIGAGARVVLSPWRGLRVEGHAGLQLVLGAPSFDIEALRSVYESKTLQPTARVALGWEFGAP